MKRLLIAAALLLPSAAMAETKTFNYKCRGGPLTVKAEIDRSQGYEAWGKSIVITVPGDTPQTLTRKSASEDLFGNGKYEFYSFKAFTNVTKAGTRGKFLDACK